MEKGERLQWIAPFRVQDVEETDEPTSGEVTKFFYYLALLASESRRLAPRWRLYERQERRGTVM